MTTDSQGAPAPYEFLLLKVRVNPRKIAALRKAGLRVVERTDTHQLELRAAHEAQRGARHYVRLGVRKNATGATVGDSGTLRIKFNPDMSQNGGAPADPDKAITVGRAAEDLEAIGYRFQDAHVLQRPEEPNGMGFLVVVMQLSAEPAPITKAVADLINQYVDGNYRTVFVYENPDGSATVNANHAVVGGELEQATDKRELRFRFEDGATHWESAKPKAAATKAEASPAA